MYFQAWATLTLFCGNWYMSISELNLYDAHNVSINTVTVKLSFNTLAIMAVIAKQRFSLCNFTELFLATQLIYSQILKLLDRRVLMRITCTDIEL